ncbi:hypothetical protein WCU84_15455 [Dickeya chrysanthemi]|uniref:Lipoprotein n=1 Tax=Dickeya chrysanthemi TaxID=556 RepID=A0ABU8JRH5_DICCH
MMILKKRLMSLLCLPIAISLVSISPSYAFTNEQYKTLIYGLAAGGAWSSWYILDEILDYINRGGGPLTTEDGSKLFGLLCGVNAAAIFRTWRPPTDPISAANILLAATKGGAVIASSTTCRWVSNAILKLSYENAQSQASKMNPKERRILYHDANVLITLKIKLAEQIDTAVSKKRAADNYAATLRHDCPYGIVSRYCNDLGEQLYRESIEAKAAYLAVKQTAWDIAHVSQQIGYEEHLPIVSQHKMSPRPG